MPYQESVDIGGKLSTHQKLHCLVVKISKSINISDPVFMEVSATCGAADKTVQD